MNIPEDLKELLNERATYLDHEDIKYIELNDVIDILSRYALPKNKEVTTETLLED